MPLEDLEVAVEDMKQRKQAIKEQNQQKLEKLEQQLTLQKNKLKLAKAYKGDPPKDKEELKELFQLLCFNNLGFCCSTDKDCPMRDTVLEILGIDKDKFQELKKNFGFQLAGFDEGD